MDTPLLGRLISETRRSYPWSHRRASFLQELIKHDPSVQKSTSDRSSVGSEHFLSHMALQRIRSQPIHARLPSQHILIHELRATRWTTCICCHCRRLPHCLLEKT